VVGMRGAARALLREGSGLAFYRGIGVAMLGAQASILSEVPGPRAAAIKGWAR